MKNKRVLTLIISLTLIFSNTTAVFASTTDTSAGVEAATEADSNPRDNKLLSIAVIGVGFLVGNTMAKKKRK